jgi:hypothetical protein
MAVAEDLGLSTLPQRFYMDRAFPNPNAKTVPLRKITAEISLNWEVKSMKFSRNLYFGTITLLL